MALTKKDKINILKKQYDKKNKLTFSQKNTTPPYFYIKEQNDKKYYVITKKEIKSYLQNELDTWYLEDWLYKEGNNDEKLYHAEKCKEKIIKEYSINKILYKYENIILIKYQQNEYYILVENYDKTNEKTTQVKNNNSKKSRNTK